MNGRASKVLTWGVIMIAIFAMWTAMICTVDVRAVGQRGTSVGFAGLNTWFHGLTGVHMMLYTVTDWLGLVPIAVCFCFGILGLIQLVSRRRFLKIDGDLLLLGAYYVIVILFYLLFEMIPINYRPVLIDGYLEASYPSSTTLLVLSVMPTLSLQAGRRIGNRALRNTVRAFSAAFSLFMVAGRTVSGVHWLTDILGSVFLSAGLYLIYRACVGFIDNNGKERENGIQ